MKVEDILVAVTDCSEALSHGARLPDDFFCAAWDNSLGVLRVLESSHPYSSSSSSSSDWIEIVSSIEEKEKKVDRKLHIRLDERNDVEIEIMITLANGTSEKKILSNKGERKFTIDTCGLKYRVVVKSESTTMLWGYAFTVRGLRGKTSRIEDLKRLVDSKIEIEAAVRNVEV